MRRLPLGQPQLHRSPAPNCAVLSCRIGLPFAPSVKVVTPPDVFGFVGSHRSSVGNRACFVNELSRRRLNVRESSRAVHSSECAALSRTLAVLHKRICSFKVKPYRSPSVNVAGIEAMFQLNQRANPSVKRTRNGKPRMAFISFWATHVSPLRAAYLER